MPCVPTVGVSLPARPSYWPAWTRVNSAGAVLWLAQFVPLTEADDEKHREYPGCAVPPHLAYSPSRICQDLPAMPVRRNPPGLARDARGLSAEAVGGAGGGTKYGRSRLTGVTRRLVKCSGIQEVPLAAKHPAERCQLAAYEAVLPGFLVSWADRLPKLLAAVLRLDRRAG
jgi:hypothetical protein